jgi:hypothetical protein
MAKQISFEFEKKKYTLEYTLRTAGQCEQDGFIIDALGDKPATMIPLLFHWAFVRHHRGITKQQTSKIYDQMNHKTELVTALAEMYADAVSALVDTDDEEDEGNANWTMT